MGSPQLGLPRLRLKRIGAIIGPDHTPRREAWQENLRSGERGVLGSTRTDVFSDMPATVGDTAHAGCGVATRCCGGGQTRPCGPAGGGAGLRFCIAFEKECLKGL